MSHNRIRANKNTYDRRSQSGPSARYAESLKLFGKSQPSWKWRGTGKHDYTTSPAAAAYVAAFAQRKQAADLARIARYAVVPAVKPITDSARLIEAGRNRASNHSPIVDGASSAEE